MEAHLVEVIGLLLLGIIGWFLRSKDEAQEKQITALWTKHDEDVRKLEELQLHVAKEHYIKAELDQKFDRMEATFKHGFESLGKQFSDLAKILVDHTAREDAREDARWRKEQGK